MDHMLLPKNLESQQYLGIRISGISGVHLQWNSEVDLVWSSGEEAFVSLVVPCGLGFRGTCTAAKPVSRWPLSRQYLRECSRTFPESPIPLNFEIYLKVKGTHSMI